jgi:Holliday junction resolvase-like predicted endonuclease
MQAIAIIKADGTRESFRVEKLERSLIRAGANADEAKRVAAHVVGEIREGMRTSEIYRHAFEYLRQHEARMAPRYSLKRALAELGPTGFPFEKFVAELLQTAGYATALNVHCRGRCVEHELDVVAWKGEETVAIEAKFHHEVGLKSDVKVALYVKARFDDLVGQSAACAGTERVFTGGRLITNTKFTDNAIQYARCAGLPLIGWNYPERGNLHHLIDAAGPALMDTLFALGADKTLAK